MLALDELENTGGSRIHFAFAIGNKSVSSFFYYSADVHEPMRSTPEARARQFK